MSVRFRVSVAPALVAACLLAGCGGGSGGGGAPTTSQPGSSTSATFRLGALASTVRSAAVAFSTGPIIEVALPAGCPASPSCAITVPAPAGETTSAYRVYVYPTADGSGTALEMATGDVDFVAGGTTTTSVAFRPVMDSFTMTVSPVSYTAQTIAALTLSVVAKDVSGATIGFPYYAKNGARMQFTVDTTFSDGSTQADQLAIDSAPTVATYDADGFLPNPLKFTARAADVTILHAPISGYAPVTVTVSPQQPTNSVGYALAPNQLDLYTAGTATLARSFYFAPQAANFVRFDRNGTVWVDAPGPVPVPFPFTSLLEGATAQGAGAGPILAPSVGDFALSFDAAGRLYVGNASTRSVSVYSVDARSALTPVRTLSLAASPCSATADASGALYVALCGTTGVTEYAPTSNAAIASNPTASAPVAVDPSGNVFAMYGATIGEWTAGTFGPNAPARTLGGLPCALSDLGAAPTGAVYALTGPTCAAGNVLYYYAPGSTSPALLQRFSTTLTADYTGQHAVAVPLK